MEEWILHLFSFHLRMNENCLALAQCGSMIGREAKRRYESISFLLLSFVFMVRNRLLPKVVINNSSTFDFELDIRCREERSILSIEEYNVVFC